MLAQARLTVCRSPARQIDRLQILRDIGGRRSQFAVGRHQNESRNTVVQHSYY